MQDFLVLHGEVYMASYGLALADPLLTRTNRLNPELIPSLSPGPATIRTAPWHWRTDGQSIYMASCADYGHLGGAISSYAPGTGEMKTYRHIVEDQQVATLVYEPESGLLAAGTFINGEACQPTPDAGILASSGTRARPSVFMWNIPLRMPGDCVSWLTMAMGASPSGPGS